MLPSSTPAVTRAVEVGRRLAASRSSASTEAGDLLRAMLDEEFGRAASLAEAAGLDLSRLSPVESAPAGAEVPLSSRAESLFYTAREIGFDLAGEGVVTSEALLLAILREVPEAFAEAIRLGLDAGRLETALAGQRRAAPPIEEAFHLAETTERMDTARVLDASANRAREALRILEDYARFVLNDAILSEHTKRMRHDFSEAMRELAPPELIWARDTPHDVGTAISTPGELHRESLRAVAAANLKRLQEALRSVEEFAKIGHSALAARVEQVRYRGYTLERAFLLGVEARDRLRDVRLCVLLSGEGCRAALDWTIAEAAAGGVGMVQLREKNLPDRDLIARARQVRRWTHRAGVLFIVNDRPDIARLVEADGVHLGQDDLPVHEARRLLGAGAILGVSTHDLDQVRRAVLDGATYLGVGPVFASKTKQFGALAGLDFVRAAMAETTLPAFAIGGIDATTIDAAVAAGVRRVAVGHAVAGSDDPRAAARVLVEGLNAANEPEA